MADQFQTSFIPKKTFDLAPTPSKKTLSLAGLISLGAILLFIVSIVSAGGVFLYERFLESSIQNKKDSLEKAKAAFEPELIRELSRLDSKFTVSKGILDAHVAPSGIFDLLEAITLQTVHFTSFNYTLGEKGVAIVLQGEAGTFASVALQSDEFAKNRSIREPVFSGLTLDTAGNVDFTVNAIIDRTVLSYKERVLGAGTAMFEVAPAPALAEEPEEVAGASTETNENGESPI